VIDLLPHEDLVYFGDTGRYPYGSRDPAEVRRFAREITDVLVRDHGVKVVIVACNTAAAAALEDLQATCPVPVLGVIGTVGTIGSGAYQQAVADAHAGVKLTCAACPGFVEFVEAGDVESDQVHVLAERLLAPVRDATVDTLVLGCTHYPLLARTIGDVMGRDVVLVSSADETAFAVRDLLTAREMLAPGPPTSDSRHVFLTSGRVDTFRTLGVRFLGPEVAAVEPWHWG
jgi:glutamate racemase